MSCKKRRKFVTESHAHVALWAMKLRGEMNTRPPQPFRCEVCGYWHLMYQREGAAKKRKFVQPFLEGM